MTTNNPDERQRELLQRLHEVRMRPGGIFADLLRRRPIPPEPEIEDPVARWTERRREILLAAIEKMHSIEADEAKRRANADQTTHDREESKAALRQMLQAVMEQLHATPIQTDADRVALRLQRLSKIYIAACEDYQRRHSTILYPMIAAAALHLRRKTARARARVTEAINVAANAIGAAGNTITAAVLATTLFVAPTVEAANASFAGHTSIAGPSRAVPLSPRSPRSQIKGAIPTRGIERELALRAQVPGEQNGPSGSLGVKRQGRRFTISRDLNGWLAPGVPYVSASGTLLWVNCEESMSGRVLCSALEPTFALLPPPPKLP